MLEEWTGGVMFGVALAIGLLARARRRTRVETAEQTSLGKAVGTAMPKPTDPAPSPDIRWPIDPTVGIKRVPHSVRVVVIARGLRPGHLVRCVECEVGGRQATEMVRVNSDGEDLGAPEYLWGYSVERAIRELTG